MVHAKSRIESHERISKIDCTNGFDEQNCNKLELNECDETNEYRCLNGQCIDKVFYRDQYPDCADHSDEKFTSARSCFHNFGIQCEERWCPSMWFSCGDGHCYDGPNINDKNSCASQRDRLYLKQMMPSTLILFSHVTLVYKDNKPELICYNESLCPYLFKNDYFTANIMSINGSTCQLLNNQTFTNPVHDVKRLVRSCSLLPHIQEFDQCLSFQCTDGSKCLSHHRLLDGYEDCSNGEDERQNNTCTLNHSYRFTCDSGTRCIHPWAVANRIVKPWDSGNPFQPPSIPGSKSP
ncbi:unnamed protein product [Adineta ricciae]|uniref:Uncharacterized protein n=1 Tax=Adineta ricciae TaxID=249248 RepID=A0A814MQG7_ADIRI|nr:unnamed protein product [Adineta ricciae]